MEEGEVSKALPPFSVSWLSIFKVFLPQDVNRNLGADLAD